MGTAVGVPEITPVVELMPKPEGNPLADHVVTFEPLALKLVAELYVHEAEMAFTVGGLPVIVVDQDEDPYSPQYDVASAKNVAVPGFESFCGTLAVVHVYAGPPQP